MLNIYLINNLKIHTFEFWRYAMKGTVKWFNNQRGYGFISDEEDNDIFVHYSALNMDGFKSLSEGDAVSFEITTGAKGPLATKVVKL